jgi:hypothetical protein
VRSTPRPGASTALMTRCPLYRVQSTGWVPEPVWTGVEKLAPTGIRFLDRPAHRYSLYWRCRRGPHHYNRTNGKTVPHYGYAHGALTVRSRSGTILRACVSVHMIIPTVRVSPLALKRVRLFLQKYWAQMMPLLLNTCFIRILKSLKEYSLC